MPTTVDLVTRCRPLLGTFVEITTPDGHGEAVNAAFDMIAHIHARMSFHEPASDLAAIRNALPGERIAVDQETVEVLRTALALHEATNGLFDIAVGRKLVRRGFLPRGDIGPLRQFDGTAADITIEDDKHVSLKRRMLVDLGGIAKGYAVDRAVEVIARQGVPFGLVNAGGDLRAFGPIEWNIGLRDADDLVRSSITIRHCAMASSANLGNRRRLRGSQHTPHIGRNGQPVLAEQRTTVMAEWCVIADAMTKVAMVDPDLADTILSEFKGHILRETLSLGTA
ncbi:MAG: FAD:protein FMN transferase [Sphingomonadales bacterium]|nr:FAD:protein FMN transferase [Sphingomonadales bacterium]MDE2169256.1 FAD:protein FMN transferase [Sphingomonadales bacterium]